MRTLLVINNNSAEAKHAAKFALAIAKKTQANILIANTFKVSKARFVERVTAGGVHSDDVVYQLEEELTTELLKGLKVVNDETAFKPTIEEFDVSDMDEIEVAEFIIKNNIWMMVKGISNVLPSLSQKKNLNAHAILNKVLCPLLLVPIDWQLKEIERLVYIADLRYCRIEIVRYLAQLAKPFQSALSIAHLSAKGLPDMAEKYALNVFSDEISSNVRYEHLFFNNIREKNLAKAVDVLINGMHNDVLVMVNHRFHFEEIVGRYIPDALPKHITIPLLVFPY